MLCARSQVVHVVEGVQISLLVIEMDQSHERIFARTNGLTPYVMCVLLSVMLQLKSGQIRL